MLGRLMPLLLVAGSLGVESSVGEFAGFLLGWFGADIAGDDRPLVPAAVATPGR